MKLEAITVAGFTTYGQATTLDLAALGPGLFAIVGDNGSGKTTLLEAPIAALYRTFPTRGDLPTYATGRESCLEALWSLGDRPGLFRARVNVDGSKRSTDAVLVHEPGPTTPIKRLNDGKASTYDKAVAQVFPPLEVVLASAFAAQDQTGNFVALKPAARRELFGQLLGLEGLVAMGQTAKRAAALVAEALGRQRALAQAAAGEAVGADEALARKTAAVETRARLDAEILELEARLATYGDAVAAHGAARQRELSASNVVDRTRKRIDAVDLARLRAIDQYSLDVNALDRRWQAAREDLDGKIRNNQTIQGRAAEIRAAVARLAELDEQIAKIEAELPAARQAERDARAARDQALDSIARLDVVEGKLERARRDAGILETVPCHGAGEYAACQFLTDAEASRAELARLVDELKPKAEKAQAYADARLAHENAQRLVAELEKARGEASSLRAPLVSTAGWLSKLEVSDERLAELEQLRTRAYNQTQADLAELKTRHDAARRELEDELATERALLETQELELAEARAEVELVAGGHQQATTTRAALDQSRRLRDEANVEAAYAASRIERASEAAQRLERAEQKIRILEQHRIEWDFLAKALGREGLPELEIDAAGPTIAGYTNQLLEASYGARFSVDLVTQIDKADGKGQKAELTIRVTDNQAGGAPRDLGDLSGGEKVIVGEALRCAISVYANRRSPSPMRTCWRDETDSALLGENAVRYLTMLRKMQELGGYDQILFITHNQEAAAQADAQVVVRAGGTLDVRRPPYVRVA